MSSAAILAVYTAGFVRTWDAAERLELEAARRRRIPALPGGPPSPPSPPVARAAITPPTPASPVSPAEPTPSPPPTTVLPAAPTPSPTPAPSPTATPVPTPSPEPQPTPTPPPSAPPETEGDAAPAEPTDDDPKPAIAYRDGTYLGWGRCRHGQMQAEVVVESGRIVSAKVAVCRTAYTCSWVNPLVPEVVDHQGPPVTYIGGASESSDAFYYAVVDALSQAQ